MKPTLRMPGSSLRPVFPEWRLWCDAYSACACVRSVARHGSMCCRVIVRNGEDEVIVALGSAQRQRAVKRRRLDTGAQLVHRAHRGESGFAACAPCAWGCLDHEAQLLVSRARSRLAQPCTDTCMKL
eukprot:6212508-Pleurochrysis_carterae.AAC.3